MTWGKTRRKKQSAEGDGEKKAKIILLRGAIVNRTKYC